MPGLPYIAAAYGVIWVLLFVYLLTIHQRLTNVREELDASRRRSEADEERQPTGMSAREPSPFDEVLELTPKGDIREG